MTMQKTVSCSHCSNTTPRTSTAIGICVNCLRTEFPSVRKHVEAVHAASRAEFDLPAKPPHNPDGIQCNLCSNECVIGEEECGFCGLRTVRKGKLVHLAGTPKHGILQWYYDRLPTNCVADWVCEGNRQQSYHNLAVFYESCTANCLFCQNWHFRRTSPSKSKTISADELASAADSRTFCICFFGGDPASQMPHALATSRHLAQRGVRVCWETNGMMHPGLLDRAVKYSFQTGGCIKFDLKAFDEEVHLALTGVSNRRVRENFMRAAQQYNERPELPLVVVSTLLVPGYVDVDQVSKIAGFIASVNPQIPYSLLAFAPDFYMNDLPCTSVDHAQEAEAAARRAGLVNVRTGNRHLLGLGLK